MKTREIMKYKSLKLSIENQKGKPNRKAEKMLEKYIKDNYDKFVKIFSKPDDTDDKI